MIQIFIYWYHYVQHIPSVKYHELSDELEVFEIDIDQFIGLRVLSKGCGKTPASFGLQKSESCAASPHKMLATP